MATYALCNLENSEMFELKGAIVYTIGRAPGNWVRLDNPQVQSYHVKLIRIGDKVRMEKFSENASVYLNDDFLDFPKFLKEKDVISIGNVRLRFQQIVAEKARVTFLTTLKVNEVEIKPQETQKLDFLSNITLDKKDFYKHLLENWISITKALGGLILKKESPSFLDLEKDFSIVAIQATSDLKLPSNLLQMGEGEKPKIAWAGSLPDVSTSVDDRIALAYLYLPLISEGRCRGAIVLIGAIGISSLFQKALPVFWNAARSYIAQFISLLEEYNLYEASLREAREIQGSLLPVEKSPQTIEYPISLDIAGCYQPVGYLGGDHLDFLFSRDESQLYFCIGDVSGKGPAASLVMATVRAYFRLLAEQRKPTHEIVEQINIHLYEDLQKIGDRFITMIVFRWDEMLGKIYYTAAGHPLWIIRQNGQVEPHSEGGIVLGLLHNLNDEQHREVEISLAEGETLILATDGVWEARSKSGEEWDQRFLESLKTCKAASAQKTLENIIRDLNQFTQGVEVSHDDITLLVIQKKSKPIVMVKRMLHLYREKNVDIEKSLETLKKMLEDTSSS